jgi:hypothetical protein
MHTPLHVTVYFEKYVYRALLFIKNTAVYLRHVYE